MKDLGPTYRDTFNLFHTNQMPNKLFALITKTFDFYSTMVDEILKSEFADQPYYDLFGGKIQLVESKEDLREISTGIASVANDRWLTLYEVPESFDVCDWTDKDQDFVQVVMCWNDAGGPLYFIPKEFVTENVLDSIKLTNAYWERKDNEDNTN
jgi:hypothetical protein